MFLLLQFSHLSRRLFFLLSAWCYSISAVLEHLPPSIPSTCPVYVIEHPPLLLLDWIFYHNIITYFIRLSSIYSSGTLFMYLFEPIYYQTIAASAVVDVLSASLCPDRCVQNTRIQLIWNVYVLHDTCLSVCSCSIPKLAARWTLQCSVVHL